MKKSEIQQLIFDQTGIKTSVRKLSGSMKIYTAFTPMLQGGIYPKFEFTWMYEFKKQFSAVGTNPGCYVSGTMIHVLNVHIEESEPIKYKTECKPKSIEEMKVKQWGSKNSQMRLDKNAARYAKKLRGPNGDKMARYY